MQTEFEAKAIKINKDDMRTKLVNLGATCEFKEQKFRRATFDNPEFRKNNTWIRVRDEGSKITLAIKSVGNASSIHALKELSLKIDSFDTAVEFIQQLGFMKKGYEENFREEWKFKDVIFDIDTWPLIDPFLEIEAPTENLVKEYFEVLGLDYSKAIFGSADILYRDVYNIEILGRESLLFEN